jgi:hypothetical protein
MAEFSPAARRAQGKLFGRHKPALLKAFDFDAPFIATKKDKQW